MDAPLIGAGFIVAFVLGMAARDWQIRGFERREARRLREKLTLASAELTLVKGGESPPYPTGERPQWKARIH